MDRQRIARRILIVYFVGGVSALLAAETLSLKALNWLAPQRAEQALLTAPSECIAEAQNEQQRISIEIGRAAFRAPLLLGGQAARSGLSCESCHRNGRGNPDFFFKGLSSTPGTADVTSSFMSSHRGDGVFNPKLIPDLAAAPETMKISRDTSSRELEKFIRGLIVEEFDGPEPSERSLQGLADYVRLLDAKSCEATMNQALRVENYSDDASRAVAAAQRLIVEKDFATARLMISSARSSLGLIHERYDTAELSQQRRMLRLADSELAAVQARLDRNDADASLDASIWLSQWPSRTKLITQTESASLFNPQKLRDRF
jgi:hypothetical protein